MANSASFSGDSRATAEAAADRWVGARRPKTMTLQASFGRRRGARESAGGMCRGWMT